MVRVYIGLVPISPKTMPRDLIIPLTGWWVSLLIRHDAGFMFMQKNARPTSWVPRCVAGACSEQIERNLRVCFAMPCNHSAAFYIRPIFKHELNARLLFI